MTTKVDDDGLAPTGEGTLDPAQATPKEGLQVDKDKEIFRIVRENIMLNGTAYMGIHDDLLPELNAVISTQVHRARIDELTKLPWFGTVEYAQARIKELEDSLKENQERSNI